MDGLGGRTRPQDETWMRALTPAFVRECGDDLQESIVSMPRIHRRDLREGIFAARRPHNSLFGEVRPLGKVRCRGNPILSKRTPSGKCLSCIAKPHNVTAKLYEPSHATKVRWNTRP